MAHYKVPVDQVTLLDPHDFDQSALPVDGEQQQALVGQPQPATDPSSAAFLRNYGATIWDNVSFADVYYQTRGTNDGSLMPDALVPLVDRSLARITAG